MKSGYGEFADIAVSVRCPQTGTSMTIGIPFDADLDDWAGHLKTILVFLGFAVDNIAINPESDDPQGDKNERD